jgi:predicted  nucleic acid-binding Zn-ribbon protein
MMRPTETEDAMADVSLEMLQSLMRQMLDEQKAARKEAADVRGLVLALTDQVRRLDRRVGEVRDDIEVMLRAEIMGRLGNAERDAEARIGELEARIAAIEERQRPST